MMMMDNRKSLLAVFAFAMVTLLGFFSPVSSLSVLPLVTRTRDAVIIDYTDSIGYVPSYDGDDEFANPGLVPVPTPFNPYAMLQQQSMFYKGWPYFGRQAVTAAPACGRGPTALPARSLDVTGRLVTASKKNSWPFLVVLKKSSDADGVYFCSGSLISDTKVLLAAQCLEKLSPYEISAVTVLVGAGSITEVQMTRRISKVVLHGKYNAATYANDIAIITLDMPVVLSKTVSTICLPPASTDPDNYIDQEAAVIGWAEPNDKDNKVVASKGLKQGKVSIVANADCKAVADIGQFITDSNTCVSSEKVFTCAGDIGGPIAVITSAPTVTPVTWTLVAINSYTKATCDATGLKTRVSAFRAWIDTYMV